jgi:hypothetical protein
MRQQASVVDHRILQAIDRGPGRVVHAGWTIFEKALPEHLTDIERGRMRDAWFTGAVWLWGALAGSEGVPDADGHFNAIAAELEPYRVRMRGLLPE